MTKLLLYAYCVGAASSRRTEERTYADVGFRVIAAGDHLDGDTICQFCCRHREALGRFLAQVLFVCRVTGP